MLQLGDSFNREVLTMKKAPVFLVSIVLFLFLMVVTMPLSSQQNSQPQSGVALLERSDNSLILKALNGGHEFTIEIKRGPRTPLELYLADPLTPRYELDIRILDQHGFPIFTQFGGHAPIDPAWDLVTHDPFLLYYHQPGDVLAAENFILVAEAIAGISNKRFDSELTPELNALKRLVPLLVDFTKEEAVPDEEIKDKAVLYRNKIAIHDAAVRFTFGWGRHGATLLKNISSSGSVFSGWSACNHGRCPSEMPQKCAWTSAIDRPFLTLAPMCSTPYSAFSSSGKHNSNDDTDIQYDGVRWAYTPSSTAGKCSDSVRNDAPSSCY